MIGKRKRQSEAPGKKTKTRVQKTGQGTLGAAYWGAWGGMFVFGLMFFFCLWQSGGFADLKTALPGADPTFFTAHVKSALILQGKILVAYQIVGAAIGLFFGLVGGGFAKKSDRRGKLYLALCSILGSLMTQLLIFLYAMGQAPYYYAWLLDQVGLPGLQGVTSLVLVPPVMLALLALLAFVSLWTIAKRISRQFGGLVLLFAIVGGMIGLYHLHTKPAASVPTGKTRPNVLFLVADTLRPDHLSSYGHFQLTSPHIDKLAANGQRFGDVTTPIARSFPSMATLLTGQNPHTHGIRTRFPDAADTKLPDGLGHLLQGVGYRTAVIAGQGGEFLSRLDAGFETVAAPGSSAFDWIATDVLAGHWWVMPYLDNRFARKHLPAINTITGLDDPGFATTRFLQFVDESPDTPFFGLVYYSTTRSPFASRYPDYKRFTSRSYAGQYTYGGPDSPDAKDVVFEDIVQVRNLYDGAVAAFDDQVGRMVQELKKRSVFDQTLILVTGARGEDLFDDPAVNGSGDHLRGVASLQVPLVIHWPEGFVKTENRVVNARISTTDIAPTLIAALGIEAPGRIDGKPLTDLLAGRASKVHEYAFAETGLWDGKTNADYLKGRRIDYPALDRLLDFAPDTGAFFIKPKYRDIVNIAKHRMVTDGRLKLVAMPTSRNMRYECYNLLDDPGEQTDLLVAQPAFCAEHMQALTQWIESAPGTVVQGGFALPAD